MILLIGANGSMGLRYQAILKHLGKDFLSVDIDTKYTEFFNLAKTCQGAIIASPTQSHFSYLDAFSSLSVPVLCEKPLTKSLGELKEIRDNFVIKKKLNLTMTMQYKMLDTGIDGYTLYDYFRHGNDGLAWDCIQPIGLARGPVEIKESSPIWRCILNGKVLNLGDMDKAYVDFVYNWLERPGDDIDELFGIHMKVMDWQYGKKH